MSSTYPAGDMRHAPTTLRVTNDGTVLGRISWAAVIAGGIIAVVMQLLLTLLGTGIGLSTVDPMTAGATPDAASLGIGASVWWSVSSILSLCAGGWTAAHLAGSPKTSDAVLHGLLTWGLATLVAVYLVASALSSVVRGASSVIGGAASMTASAASAAAAPAAGMIKDKLDSNSIDLASIKSGAMKLLTQTGKPGLQPGALQSQASSATSQAQQTTSNAAANPQSSDADLGSMLDNLSQSAQGTANQVDKDAVVNVVMARAGVSREEATQRVDQWMATYQQAKDKLAQQKAQAVDQAKSAADATAKATSRAAFGAFFALLLGAVGAAVGGAMGRPRAVVAAAR